MDLSQKQFNIGKYVPESIQKILLAGAVLVGTTPGVWAYSLGLPIFDLWAVFVEAIFGGFWLSIFGLMFIIGIILVLGGISALTIIYFELIFLFSMVIGYGYNIITIPLFAIIMFWSVIQAIRFINASNY